MNDLDLSDRAPDPRDDERRRSAARSRRHHACGARPLRLDAADRPPCARARTSSRRAPSSSTPSRTGTRAELREELGDLLWQVLFHAEIASRDPEDPFDIDDVARGLTDKMVRRHPHVFAGEVAETPEQVLVLWNAAKAAEKHQRTSVLDGVASGCRRSRYAQKLVGKAAQVEVRRRRTRRGRGRRAQGSRPRLNAVTLCSTLVALARANGSGRRAALARAAASETGGMRDARRLRERLRVLEA